MPRELLTVVHEQTVWNIWTIAFRENEATFVQSLLTIGPFELVIFPLKKIPNSWGIVLSIYPMSGGCACGRVRYKLLAAPLSVQHCHCEICRKVTGQFSSSGAVVRKKDIEILGAENLTSFRVSKSYERQFCSICGGRLFGYEDSEALLMYFTPATLDGGKHPGHPAGSESHIYVNSKAEWETIGDGLPQFEATSPDEIMTDFQRKDSL